MANTLTNLIPDIMTALDVVSREKIGFITAVSADARAERAALNQTVYSPVAPAASSADNTANVTPPDTGDQTIGNTSITISKSKHVPVRWNGEETMGLRNAGNYARITQDRFAQAFRTLANLIEVDLGALYIKASRAYGTAGTAPFATAGSFLDFAGAAQILDDNGAPDDGNRQLVLGSAAMANLRGKQSGLFQVNTAGSSDMLRTGMTDRVEGFALRYSGQIASHTKGTGASYDTDLGASLVAGDTAVNVDTGTGTILAGDVITFDGDTNKYVNSVSELTGGDDVDITIAAPGLRAGLADGKDVTIGNAYTANMAFHRSAIVLATRLPAMPEGGDMATDVIQVMDPISGLVYEIAEYKQFLQTSYHVRLAWGVAAPKTEHIALLLG